MTVKVAINGFGRIGRNILRAIVESGRTDIQVVSINDLGPVETNAHLLRYDSVHGKFPAEVKVDGDFIVVNDQRIKVTAIKDPAQLPHKELGVDIALECTGFFTSKEKASAHLTAGAKRVIVSAPADGADLTVVYGVNHDKLTKDHIVISNASCTTNCLAPVAKVLHDAVGIEKGFMTTIHSYTNDQPSLDQMHKDLYRARAAAVSMIPTSTGAAKAVGPRAAGTQRQARRHLDPRADAERLGGGFQVHRRSARPRSRKSTTPSRPRPTARSRACSPIRTSRRSRSISTTIRPRRPSTWTRPRCWTVPSFACCRGTITNGASRTGWRTPPSPWRS